MAATLIGSPVAQEDPISSLVRSDRLRARALAHHDGRLAVESLELAASVNGRVFAPGGKLADIGYAKRHAEAVALAGQDAALRARIQQLPDVERGAAAGPLRLASSRPYWQQPLTFKGGELAAVYVKASSASPITLKVEAEGRTQCTARRASGRALCRWRPRATGEAIITISGARGMSFELFTN
ncbi:hypothetical protein [Sphingomonas pituitosa]|uniref:hypothetical protein n=1 Tax=Sphingomonas pituitosa TaxID=99597 RepID=UPI0008362495|nr:hypothetical protein [Sphingomonas pituitosa]